MYLTNKKWLRRLLLSIAYTLGIVGIVATGGGGSGGGGGDDVNLDFPIPELPAGAVILNAGNGEPVADDAVQTIASLNVFVDLLALKTETPPAIKHVIQQAKDQFYKRDSNTPSVATGVEEDVSADLCPGGGSAIAQVSETETSVQATVDLAGCDVGVGVVISGDLSIDGTWNDNTGDYSFRIGGTLVANGAFTIVFDNDTEGNDNTEEFSIDVTFSVDGGPEGSYLVTTRSLIVGLFGDINSGELIVEGGGNTRLLIEVTATNSAEVWLDTGDGLFDELIATIAVGPI